MSTAGCSESMRSPHIGYPLTNDLNRPPPTIHAPLCFVSYLRELW